MDRCRLAESIFEQGEDRVNSAYPEDTVEEEEIEDEGLGDNLVTPHSREHVDTSMKKHQTTNRSRGKHKNVTEIEVATQQEKRNVMRCNQDTDPWEKPRNIGTGNRVAQKMATGKRLDRLNPTYNLRQRKNNFIR